MAPASRKSLKNVTKTICSQCKCEINEEKEDNIACDKCRKTFHAQCTKLDKRQFENLVENEGEEYVCHLCEGGDDVAIKNDLKLIKTKLCQLDQLSAIHDSITFLSKQYDEVLKSIVENKKIVDEIKKENYFLKEEIKNLKTSVKVLNDDRVRNHCIVMGLKNKEDVSAADAVVDLSKDIGVEITADNIEEAFYLKNRDKKSNKRNVIVKFDTKKSKSAFMSAKSQLKANDETKNVFVNDLLSKETLNLLNYAKTLKSVGYISVFPRNGRVFAKRSELTRPRVIKSEDDVDQILLEASTNKPRKRISLNKTVAVVDSSEDDDVDADFQSPVRH